MKFSIRDFFSKSEEICSFLRIWSHLLKKCKTSFFCEEDGFCFISNMSLQPKEIYSQISMIYYNVKYLCFWWELWFTSICSKFWRLPPAFNEFVILKNTFFCFDIGGFLFTLVCGASKGFMKALEAFIKPFEAPQRSVKRCYYGQN